jgi:hypothetical protein
MTLNDIYKKHQISGGTTKNVCLRNMIRGEDYTLEYGLHQDKWDIKPSGLKKLISKVRDENGKMKRCWVE